MLKSVDKLATQEFSGYSDYPVNVTYKTDINAKLNMIILMQTGKKDNIKHQNVFHVCYVLFKNISFDQNNA